MGREGRSAYIAATELLKAQYPALAPHLTKTVGHAMGLQFREGPVVLNSKCR